MAEARVPQTASELLFERYLVHHDCGYRREEDFEPVIPGKRARPDFRRRWELQELFFEIKERSAKPYRPGAHYIQPQKGIRKLIEEGRSKFKEYTESCCSLVIYNAGDWETPMGPLEVYEAMLGDLGFALHFDPEEGVLDPDTARTVFLDRGGKMVKHYRPLEPHDSTRNIAAVIVLEEHRVPNPEYEAVMIRECTRARSRLGRDLKGEEKAMIGGHVMESLQPYLGKEPGLVVCENPFARHPLPRALFKGNYDERWALTDWTKRIFVGAALDAQEERDRSD